MHERAPGSVSVVPRSVAVLYNRHACGGRRRMHAGREGSRKERSSQQSRTAAYMQVVNCVDGARSTSNAGSSTLGPTHGPVTCCPDPWAGPSTLPLELGQLAAHAGSSAQFSAAPP